MRVLGNVRPTPEQLKIINDYRPGPMIVRGAAGSGKTTTAVLRLRLVVNIWRRAALRDERPPVKVLVLTFNRTLKGYIEELVRQQLQTAHVELTLDTFSGWARGLHPEGRLVARDREASKILTLGKGLQLPGDFLIDETHYVFGRYLPDRLDDYADTSDAVRSRRDGRGQSPAMPATRRRRLLDEVIRPYGAWKRQQGLIDWNDVALRAANGPSEDYDIIAVDEAQDFSANMARALLAHRADENSTTFVLDTTQRIYPHGFRWNAVGLDIRAPRDVVTLRSNHRNTKQIAALARPLVADLPDDEDGQLPDFKACELEGARPTLVEGRFLDQMQWITSFLGEVPDDESVALLHPKGGGWFDFARGALTRAGLPFVELQGKKTWPAGNEQIGLSTLHSSKGLEFDHVILLGLEQEHMPHGVGDEDTQMQLHRRLLAMAIGRARRSVTLTYKPGSEPDVLSLLDPATYDTVTL